MKKFIPLLLIIFSILPVLDLIRPGLPAGHDTPDHVARIANFYQSLSEGNIVPRWAGNLNWGYGHPILMFLYPLPSYVASLFHFIGFSFVDSTKLVFAVSYIASILAMYLFASTAWGPTSGVIAAVLYGYAPYRFVDLYVRGALGEHVAFVFPPLILWGLLVFSKSKCSSFISKLTISLGVAGLILSHNAVALMMLPLVFLYGVYLAFFEVKDRFHFLVLGIWCLVLGFLLSAFFWIPAFLEGKYTLRDIVTAGEALKRFVPWGWFIYSPWNYGSGEVLSKSLGIAQWIGVGTSCIVIWKTKRNDLRIFLIGTLVILFISLFIMTSESKFIWQSFTFLQKFQFPWRFLSVSVFATSILGGISIGELLRRVKYNKYLFVIFCFFIIGVTVHMWHPKGYQIRDESIYRGLYPGTTDTGESSPIWSIRQMGQSPTEVASVLEGRGTITQTDRNTTHRQYFVIAEESLRIAENTLYFPGWKVFIDGKETQIEYQDPGYRGLMTFFVPVGKHIVTIVFSDTKVRRVANSISIISLGLLCVFYFVWTGTIKTRSSRI